MPWSGSAPNQTYSRTDGTRTGSTTWAQADAADVGILSADHDTHDQDIAAAISATLKKDGGNKPTANINWGGYKITDLAAPTSDNDAARKVYVDDAVSGVGANSSDTKSAAYTVTDAENKTLFLCDATSAAFTLTLLAAATAGDGFEIAVKKTDSSANAITIDGDGSEEIDGATTLELAAQYDVVVIRSDGSGWSVVAKTITATAAANLGQTTLTKTAAYTVTTSDFGALVDCDATSAAFTVTLPTASSAGDGFEITVKKTDSSENAITVDGDGSETIDGATTISIATQYQSAVLRSDGSNWHVHAEKSGGGGGGAWEILESGSVTDTAPGSGGTVLISDIDAYSARALKLVIWGLNKGATSPSSGKFRLAASADGGATIPSTHYSVTESQASTSTSEILTVETAKTYITPLKDAAVEQTAQSGFMEILLHFTNNVGALQGRSWGMLGQFQHAEGRFAVDTSNIDTLLWTADDTADKFTFKWALMALSE